MINNINVELQIIETIKQNGQDKKSESSNYPTPTTEDRRNDDKIRLEDGKSGASSSEAFEGYETSCKCEEGNCKKVMEKTDRQEV